LNIAKKWFNTISIIQIFFVVVFAGKKQPKHVDKSEAQASAETFPGGKLDILLILSMLLTMQFKCTFTKRFSLSTS